MRDQPTWISPISLNTIRFWFTSNLVIWCEQLVWIFGSFVLVQKILHSFSPYPFFSDSIHADRIGKSIGDDGREQEYANKFGKNETANHHVWKRE